MESNQPLTVQPASSEKIVMTPSKHTARLYFIGLTLGAIVLLVVLAIASLFFANNPVNSSLVVTPTATVSPSSDPLVSVVPKVSEAEVSKGAPVALVSDPKRGATNPKVTIIEFGDFQCENCAAMKDTMQKIVDEYSGTVQHVWKDFPLPQVHQYAQTAAIAARCAQDQGKFWEYHDALLTQQSLFASQPWSTIAEEAGLDPNVFSSCVSGAKTQRLVVQSYFVGQSLGLTEAPSYYVNGRFLSGAQSYETLKAVIEEELGK